MLLVSVAMAIAAVPAPAAITLTGLGQLSPLLDASSNAVAVSADGSTVIGYARNYNSRISFHWKNGTRTAVYLADFGTDVHDVSADGNLVAAVYDVTSPFLWSPPDVYRSLPRPGKYLFTPTGISGDGAVVVGDARDYNNGLAPRVVRWTAAGGTVLLPSEGGDPGVSGISLDGTTIIGGMSGVAGYWRADKYSSLGTLPGRTRSSANGVNADGSVIVGNSSGEAFRWTSDGIVGLGFLPGGNYQNSSASAVSADGTVAVGWSTSAIGGQAVIFSGGAITPLWDLLLASGIDPTISGWTSLSYISDVSADGKTFVGDGIRNGRTEGFIATIPEPGCLAVFLGVFGLSRLAPWRGRFTTRRLP